MKLDPKRPVHVAVIGKKGSGKSVLAKLFWSTWPGDRLVIDVTGDVGAEEGTRTIDELPTRWPQQRAEGGMGRKERTSLRYVPDPGSATYLDDMDRALGLAYQHGSTLVWVDEMGELFPANRTPPWARRALQQGRHRRLSLVMAGPRPIDVDPLVMAQADLVYCFRLPNPNDQRRVADLIGWPPKDFAAINTQLGPHDFLEYDASTSELTIYPPLPAEVVAQLTRKGGPAMTPAERAAQVARSA